MERTPIRLPTPPASSMTLTDLAATCTQTSTSQIGELCLLGVSSGSDCDVLREQTAIASGFREAATEPV